MCSFCNSTVFKSRLGSNCSVCNITVILFKTLVKLQSSVQGSYSNLEFQETWKKPGILKQVKKREMAWDLEPHLENLEFLLQVA